MSVDWTERGFVLAALYNLGIVPLSRGFSDVLAAHDPLYGAAGCVVIVLWGLAFFALRNRYAVAPALAAVFCLEKAFFVVHWALWMREHGGGLPDLWAADPPTALFYATYGVGDAAFMVFFGVVAWRHRAAITGPPP